MGMKIKTKIEMFGDFDCLEKKKKRKEFKNLKEFENQKKLENQDFERILEFGFRF